MAVELDGSVDEHKLPHCYLLSVSEPAIVVEQQLRPSII